MSVHHSRAAAAGGSFLQQLFLGCSAALLLATPLLAQTSYTVVDLTAAGNYDIANAVSGAVVAGATSTVPTLDPSHAAIWTADGLQDLHPAYLDDPTRGLPGRSVVTGIAGILQVGWGIGPGTAYRSVPFSWNNTAASVRVLTAPVVAGGSQALATDGSQIVGYGLGLNRDSTAGGAYHAIVWNAATGVATDLGDGGNGAQALGVGGGKQVGYTFRSSGSVATMWSGTAKSQLVIHPKTAVASQAYATDGVRQVGFAGFDLKAPGETNKGGATKRYNYAYVWTGSDVSAANIHPYPFVQSYATGVSGSRIVGYAHGSVGLGTLTSYHAIVWDAMLQPTDLNAFLPAGFVGAMATGVDAQGNVVGSMYSADGARHAVIWFPNP